MKAPAFVLIKKTPAPSAKPKTLAFGNILSLMTFCCTHPATPSLRIHHSRPKVQSGMTYTSKPQRTVLVLHEEWPLFIHRRQVHKRKAMLDQIILQNSAAKVNNAVDFITNNGSTRNVEHPSKYAESGMPHARTNCPVCIVVAHADHKEGAAVAVPVVAAGHGAEQHNGLVRVPDVELRQLLLVTRDQIPHSELPERLHEDDAAVAAAADRPIVVVVRRPAQWGCRRGGDEGRGIARAPDAQ